MSFIETETFYQMFFSSFAPQHPSCSAHRGYDSLSEESKKLIEHEDDSTADQLSLGVS